MKKKNYLEFLFLILLGALSSLSLPPYNFFIINFITFSLFFVYVFKKKELINSNHKFLYGWLFGFGYFLSNLYWISFSLTFDENFKFLIPFALILIPLFLGLFNGLTTLVIGKFLDYNFSSILLPLVYFLFIFLIKRN